MRHIPADQYTGQRSFEPMVETFQTHPDALWELRIRIPSGRQECIMTTEEHPFYRVSSGGTAFQPSITCGKWTETSALHAGDRLRLADDSIAKVVSLRRLAAADGASLTTYNLEVADHHTYFVGESGVWAHNLCGKNVEEALTQYRSFSGKTSKGGYGKDDLKKFGDWHKNGAKPNLNDNDYGGVAYTLANVALRFMEVDLRTVNKPTAKERLDAMLKITGGQALGLQALKTYLRIGGIKRTQGGWDVHHIPEKWIWADIELDDEFFAGAREGLKDLVPCIPLPGLIKSKSGRVSAYWAPRSSKKFFKGGQMPFHRGSDAQGRPGLAGELQKLRDPNKSVKVLLQQIYNLYHKDARFKQTPMDVVFRTFMNKVVTPAEAIP
jgi:hypothetical protein